MTTKERFQKLAGLLKEQVDDEVDFDIESRMAEPDISMEDIDKLCKARMAEMLKKAIVKANEDAKKYGDDSVYFGIIVLQTELEEMLGIDDD